MEASPMAIASSLTFKCPPGTPGTQGSLYSTSWQAQRKLRLEAVRRVGERCTVII